jgi:gluconolactonase
VGREIYSEAASPRFREIVPADAVVEQVSTGHEFTEGPVWDPRENCLLWVDITGDTIWKWTPGVGKSVFLRPSGKANGLTFDRQGRLVAAGWTSRRVWRMEHDGSIVPLATHHQGVRIGTPNDIVVRSDGTIYWTDGTSGLRAPGFETNEDLQAYRPGSVVFKVHPDDGEVVLVTDDVPGCNGLALSPEEKLLYVNDSRAKHIKVFDVQPDGTLENGRIWATGYRSATKVDTSGNVYVTADGVAIIDPAGEYLGHILIPEHTTNLCWGDADLKTLYVTGGHSVYRIRLAAQGVPTFDPAQVPA